MVINSKTLVFVLFLCMGISACQQSSENENRQLTKDDVLKTIEKYDEAWSRKDTSGVSSILAEEYIYFSSRGGVRSRSWMLEDLLGNPSYQIDSLNRDEITIQIHGNTAVAGSRWQGIGSYNKNPVEDNQRCSQVFISRDGRLYLASEHCTDIES